MKRSFKFAFIISVVFASSNIFAGENTNSGISTQVVPGDTTSYVFIDYVRGAKLSTGNKLDWKVSCFSTPSVTISIERSADGLIFTPLEQQFATATRCLQPFSYTDLAPKPGLNYYRVKTVDIDGSKTYSFTVPILNVDKGLVIGQITPNPVQSSSVLQISSAQKSSVNIIVSTLSGKQVNRQSFALIAGSNEINLSVGKLGPGTYQLTLITSDGEKKGLRFVKQ